MPLNPDTTPAPSAFAGAGAILFRSPPRRIGKHEWRVTVYRHRQHGAIVGYEWRRAAETVMGLTCPPGPYWRRDEHWPRYDRNDGQFAGMPRTLRRLYRTHQPNIAAHLAAG